MGSRTIRVTDRSYMAVHPASDGKIGVSIHLRDGFDWKPDTRGVGILLSPAQAEELKAAL